MWKIAYADGRLDVDEEKLIRRLADLIKIKDIDVLVWDSFGNDWANDISKQLKLPNVNIIKENKTKTKDKIAPLLIKSKIDNKDE